MSQPVFVCLKWGERYPAREANTLFRALSALMSEPFRFVCLTDVARGLDDGIEAMPIPDFALERARWGHGMWPKLSVFKPGMFEPGTPVMLLDLDLVITRDLAPVLEHLRREGGLHIIHDWHDTHERWFPKWFPNERRSNSSVVGFIAGEQAQIWDAFHDKPWDILRPQINDQEFIHRHAENRHFWPDGWMLSFKKSLAFHFPVNLLREPSRPPEGSFIVCFHGRPDPEDCAGPPFRLWSGGEKFGFFPVSWIKRYRKAYAPPE
jgi:hypothetical protein